MGKAYDWAEDEELRPRRERRRASSVRRGGAPKRLRKRESQRRAKGLRRAALALLLVFAVGFGVWYYVSHRPQPNNLREISIPSWITQDLLPQNEYSRPGTPLPQVNGVVVHYVGNPGTTAEQNRSYYESLATTHATKVSSHFLVGLDGTVLQCVPLGEISYCSNRRNADTISVECCHPDESGAFNPATLDSLTRLLNWLIETYDLRQEDILRHYDVTGKECPRYYVQHPEEWDLFLGSLSFPER